MFDYKFIVMLIVLLISVFVISNFYDKKNSNVEGFVPGHSGVLTGTKFAKNIATGKYYSTQGTVHSKLAPRHIGSGLSSSIKYNNTSIENMAFEPNTPLSIPSCDDSNTQIPTMEQISPDGEITGMPIIYDRLMHANRNSRSRGQGDFIRGDLPIDGSVVPHGWFKASSSSTPHLSLNQGAMHVLGGIDNSNIRAMTSIIHDGSGGTSSTIAGVNLSSTEINLLNNGVIDVGRGTGDVNINSYS
jgi:hypothetical protein